MKSEAFRLHISRTFPDTCPKAEICVLHFSSFLESVHNSNLNPLGKEFRPSLKTVYAKKVVHSKNKASMVSSYDKSKAQERWRMRSCGPPLGVEVPLWSHP